MSAAAPAGRVALVTGGAQRLGRALALRLAAEGCRVAVHYRHSEAEAAAVVAEIASSGGEAAAFAADVTDPEACERLIAAVVARFGALHVLVNNVGDYAPQPILDHPLDAWRSTFDSNLHSAFYMCHHALPELGRHDYARIVNIGLAGIGRVPAAPSSTAYVAAKLGVLALTRALAVAVKDAPLTVNMISPGVLDDPVAAPPLARVPKGRWGRPEELGAALAYLVSREADYVTGQHLEIAGGWGL